MIVLQGITWDHDRGFSPLAATAREYSRRHRDVRIEWNRRTLREFAEYSVLDLADRYDLIVLDHPWIGAAVANEKLLPLDDYLDDGFLDEQRRNSVGPSFDSYRLEGHQWALAIDAAAQVSAYRKDLLATSGAGVPGTWQEVFELASELQSNEARVAIPLMPVDTVPAFVSLCAGLGAAPMSTGDRVVERSTGLEALAILRELLKLCHPDSIRWNPPQLLDRMSSSGEIAYCPLLFGYSNYARAGYRPAVVHFGNVPAGASGRPSGSILGGAGLAISSRCQNPQKACDYAAFVASGSTQMGLYFDNAGQPGHEAAWLDEGVNASSNGFFAGTLATLEAAYLRPRYDGYIELQDSACLALHRYLCEAGDDNRLLDTLDELYRDSRSAPHHASS